MGTPADLEGRQAQIAHIGFLSLGAIANAMQAMSESCGGLGGQYSQFGNAK